MKKLICILLIAFILVGCHKSIELDEISGTMSDMTGYQGLESDRFYDITLDDLNLLIEEGKTFMVYCGYDVCQWCNCLVPVLNEVAIEKDFKLYYMDYFAIDNYQNVDGMSTLQDHCKEFLKEDEDGEIVFYFPSVVFVQNGKVIDLHIGTVSGHDASLAPLTEKQEARLKYILEKEYNNLLQEQK